MQKHELEHIIRAAGAITGSPEIIIVGSQALLASFPDAPGGLLISQEADLYPLDNPSLADLIDGTIGELSPFHDRFGYYAHGVGPETATLASGWRKRIVTLQNDNTRGIAGLCLGPVDIAVSKLIAGRDIDFVSDLLNFRLVRREEITAVSEELTPSQLALVVQRLSRIE